MSAAAGTAQREVFLQPCAGERMIGILHRPVSPPSRGVLIVVGGPQYRVGSHKQFALLADTISSAGFAVLRFDYRGMGDSEGALRDFLNVDADLQAALDGFFAAVPTMREVAIWGLCDAASAALLYAQRDARVRGLALLNPWVRSEQTIAQTYLKHYYWQRLTERDFWAKVLRGRFDPFASMRSLWSKVKQAGAKGAANNGTTTDSGGAGSDDAHYVSRMCQGLQRFSGQVMLILSGQDLTAREFEQVSGQSPEWQRALQRPLVRTHRLSEADHTFSCQAWRAQVEQWTLQWLRSW